MAHIKVALTTNSLTEIDADFSNARQILIYDVSANGVTFVDAIQFDGGRPDGERGPGGGAGCAGLDPLDGAAPEVLEAKYASLRGCGVLFTRRLNDFAAVRIFRGTTFPVKMEVKRDISFVLNHVQQMITANPPRWLRKRLMNDDELHSAAI